MLRFLLRELPSVILTLFLSSVVIFILPRLAPGDPAVVLAGADARPETIAAIRDELGLNQPLWQQYLQWMGGLLHGDLGESYILRRPVAQLIGSRVESTLELAALATIFMIVLGIALGMLGGSPRSAWARAALDLFNTLFVSMPAFLTGLLLILLLGIALPILPVSGEVGLLTDPEIGIQFLLLPALALAIPQAGVIGRLLQTSMLNVRSEDFVDLAVAKGVPPGRITRRHVLPNSLSSVVVVVGLRIGELLAGAIVVEAIFARNGLGSLAASSVQSRDYLVVQALIMGTVLLAVMIQLLSELVMAALDPRIRLA
jgi:peptide/nickel transport system permease protein